MTEIIEATFDGKVFLPDEPVTDGQLISESVGSAALDGCKLTVYTLLHDQDIQT